VVGLFQVGAGLSDSVDLREQGRFIGLRRVGDGLHLGLCLLKVLEGEWRGRRGSARKMRHAGSAARGGASGSWRSLGHPTSDPGTELEPGPAWTLRAGATWGIGRGRTSVEARTTAGRRAAHAPPDRALARGRCQRSLSRAERKL